MSHPFEVFGSQNLKDDDGQVIDSLLIETDAPPTPVLEPIPPTPELKPIPCTRILTGTMTMDASMVEPILLFAADTNRQQFRLDVLSNFATPVNADYVLVADEKSKLQLPVDGSVMPGGLMFRVHHNHSLILDVHTGAIWIRPNPLISGGSTIEATYVSTTK